MSFRLTGLSAKTFRPLFSLDADELRRRGMEKRITGTGSDYPCRVSLDVAKPGETVINSIPPIVTTPDQQNPSNATGSIVGYRINPVGGSLTQVVTIPLAGTFPAYLGDITATGTLLGDTGTHF